MLPLFDDSHNYGNAERIPIEVLSRPELLAELAAVSDAAMLWHGRTTDLEWIAFVSRVIQVVEQARVHFGARQP